MDTARKTAIQLASPGLSRNIGPPSAHVHSSMPVPSSLAIARNMYARGRKSPEPSAVFPQPASSRRRDAPPGLGNADGVRRSPTLRRGFCLSPHHSPAVSLYRPCTVLLATPAIRPCGKLADPPRRGSLARMSASKRSAAGQAAGYHFQIHRALVSIVRAPPGAEISIETLDDVTLTDEGRAGEHV